MVRYTVFKTKVYSEKSKFMNSKDLSFFFSKFDNLRKNRNWRDDGDGKKKKSLYFQTL